VSIGSLPISAFCENVQTQYTIFVNSGCTGEETILGFTAKSPDPLNVNDIYVGQTIYNFNCTTFTGNFFLINSGFGGGGFECTGLTFTLYRAVSGTVTEISGCTITP
jgi:hypothetical protein